MNRPCPDMHHPAARTRGAATTVTSTRRSPLQMTAAPTSALTTTASDLPETRVRTHITASTSALENSPSVSHLVASNVPVLGFPNGITAR